MKIAVLLLFLPTYAVAQDFFGPVMGQQVTPRGEVPLYDHAPSRYFGNIFNPKAATASPDSAFVVQDRQLVPSLGGTQLWLQIAPVDHAGPGAEPCGDTCWSYYGTEQSGNFTAAIGSDNPALDTR